MLSLDFTTHKTSNQAMEAIMSATTQTGKRISGPYTMKAEMRSNQADGKLMRLPAGDGGALVFRTSPEDSAHH